MTPRLYLLSTRLSGIAVGNILLRNFESDLFVWIRHDRFFHGKLALFQWNKIQARRADLALCVRPFSVRHFDFALYFRVTRTCTNIHIGDTRIQVTGHRRSAWGDVSVILLSVTHRVTIVMPGLPPLSLTSVVSGHWETASQSAITLHCGPGGCIL